MPRKRAAKPSKRWTAEEAEQELARADRSGLSDRAYAKQAGLDPQRLYWWRKRLHREAQREPAFAEVKVVAPEVERIQDGRVEVELLNGRRVWLPTSIEPSIAARLLSAIEGQPC